MNVGELRILLSQYPDDLLVHADIRLGNEKHPVELRDLFTHLTRKFERTVLSIRHWNYGKSVGMPHLSDEEHKRQRHAILDGLADENRPWKWANRRFTSIHGDLRIYHDHGGSSDTCYGTAYDPRVFDQLESDGLVKKDCLSHGRIYYSITPTGIIEANAKEA